MVTACLEMLLNSELGNAALCTLSIKNVKAGTLFLEGLFALNSMAPRALQLDRFLPVSPQRFLVDITGRNLSEVLPHERLNDLCSSVKRNLGLAIIQQIRDDIPVLVKHATALAESKLPELLANARTQLNAHLDHEIARLTALQRVNPLIRDEEIDVLKQRKTQSQLYIDKTGLEVQALRVIVCT